MTVDNLHRTGRNLPRGQPVTLIEVGDCPDIYVADKSANKEQPHANQVSSLKALEFTVKFNKQQHCVPLDHGGSEYHSKGDLLQGLWNMQ